MEPKLEEPKETKEVPSKSKMNIENINITVKNCFNLRGQKGDNITAHIRVEFGDRVLGESPKFDSSPESQPEINYTAHLPVNLDDPAALDEIVSRPVVCTVHEVLPKEKKQKDEKTLVLGQATVELSALLTGVREKEFTLTLHAVPGSPLENLKGDEPKPILTVQISTDSSLLSENTLNSTNCVTVRVGSLYSPPDSFQLTGNQYQYIAAYMLPHTADKDTTAVYTNGVLKPNADKEVPDKRMRWALSGRAQANAVYIPDNMLTTTALDKENGDYRQKEDTDFRHTAEQEKHRVLWNTERKCYLDQAADKRLQDKIANSRYWPVEVMRVMPPTTQKKGKEHSEDDGTIYHHGVAYIDISPLLYPGVDRLRGAYKIEPYYENECAEKTKMRHNVTNEVYKAVFGQTRAITPHNKKEKGKDPKKQSTTPADAQSEDLSSNTEGAQYRDAHSYIYMDIQLRRPLIRKKTTQDIIAQVSELIPPRPLHPRRVVGAEKAVADYQKQIISVAAQVLGEFRSLFADEIQQVLASTDSQQTMEDRKQRLMFELNKSGKYHSFKEQLKYAIVKIVREKFLRTEAFSSDEQLQSFLSELYVYLVDQMHVALNTHLSIEDQLPPPVAPAESNQLKHFAREAETNGNMQLAAKYYQERIALDKNDASHWLDYGIFSLYLNDLEKAEECFKECISISQTNVNGLLLCAITAALQLQAELAETCFEAAITVEPENIVAWTLFGLYYESIANDIGMEMAYKEAERLNMAIEMEKRSVQSHQAQQLWGKARARTMSRLTAAEQAAASAAVAEQQKTPSPVQADPPAVEKERAELTPSVADKGKRVLPSKAGVVAPAAPVAPTGKRSKSEIDRNKDEVQPEQTIYMLTALYLLEVKAVSYTERALSHHLLHVNGGVSPAYTEALALSYLQKGDLPAAEENISDALKTDYKNPNAWSLFGHVKYMQNEMATALDAYERCLAFEGEPNETHTILLRLASVYLRDEKFEEAKNTFLRACQQTPSCVSWLGVGIACFRLGAFGDAEDALCEANLLNNHDAEVWAYLSLVCLHTGRQLEAEQAFKFAMRLGLADETLLEELDVLQQRLGFGNPQL